MPCDHRGAPPHRSSHLLSQMDKLVRDTNLAVVIATHSWREQFAEAVTINAGQSQRAENQIKTPQAMIQGGPNPAIKNQHQGTEETLDTQL